MSLTTTQKYVLTALAPENKLSVLRKGNSGICLVASCIWDMLFAEVVAANEKGYLLTTSDLPEDLEYCRPIYEELASKSKQSPQKMILNYTTALTDKRILDLAEGIVLQLDKQGYLTAVENVGLFGQNMWKPKENLLENHFSALMKSGGVEELLVESDIMFAVLILESGLAKKFFSQSEIKQLKETVTRRDTLNFQPYLKNMINLVEQQIAGAISIATVSTILQ